MLFFNWLKHYNQSHWEDLTIVLGCCSLRDFHLRKVGTLDSESGISFSHLLVWHTIGGLPITLRAMQHWYYSTCTKP